MWERLSEKLIYLGMPVVFAYHLLCGNVFLNTSVEEATGFERVGNFFLAPTQYLLNGKNFIRVNGVYQLQQRFNYDNHLIVKSTASILSLPVSLPLGSLLKGISYLSDASFSRHQKVLTFLNSQKVTSHVDYYQTLGLRVKTLVHEKLDPPQFQRKPGEEKVLSLERELLSEVTKILTNNKIPHWADCGTCLGAYRYGGAIPWDNDVDLGILAPDFDNVIHALNALDKKKYHVQDWSNRCLPKTYIRVYIRENRNYLDIYHFAINPELKQIASIVSNEGSAFLPKSWKIRERRTACPSAYETVFPLRKGVFDGVEIYMPNQTKKYLQERYGENINPAKIYNEASGKYENDTTHPYWELPYSR